MTNSIYSTSLHSPVGDLTVFVEDDAVVALEWGWVPASQNKTPLLTEAKSQIHAYFDGSLLAFDLPLSPNGSVHQKKVWDAMLAIPYGDTKSYGALAKQIRSSAQAVGGACGRNPIPIIIPCHRVIANGEALGGYSGEGGLETKRRLLILEGALDKELLIQ